MSTKSGKSRVPSAGILSLREIIAYSFGLAGVQVLMSYVNSYQAQFYGATMAADLTAVGFVLLAAKVVSAFIDPFIGGIIDRSKFKSGKLRPFVLIGDLLFCVMTIIVFIRVPLHGFLMYAYIFVISLLMCMASTLTDVSTQGMLSVMSPDAGDRNKTAGIANVIKGMGFAVCFVVIPVVCSVLKTGDRPMGTREYTVSTLLMVALAAILISLIWFRTKERVPYTAETVTIKEIAGILKRNKYLRRVFLSQMLGSGRSMSSIIQVQAAAVVIGTVTIGNFVIGGENAGLIMGASCAISSTISAVLMPILNKKLGERKLFIIMAIYGLVTGTAAFVLYAAGLRSLVWVLVGLFLAGAMYGPHTFLPLVMIPECSDYYEYTTGKRADAIHFAVLSLANKLSAAINVGVGLAIVGIAGYTPGCEITSKMQVIVYAAYILIPAVSCVLAMLPIMGYDLVGDKKEKIHAELEARRNKNAGNASD